MILLIDNYDSFSYNLYQLIGALDPNITVVRNNQCSLQDIEAMQPKALVISPGPGRPEHAGICIDAIKHFAPTLPILGICLGHQAICKAFGGVVTYAEKMMHGKTSLVTADSVSTLFADLPTTFSVARYHSLVAEEASLPSSLRIVAKTEDNVIMAVEHTQYPVYGLQFHPESILTPVGKHIAKNFLESIQ